MSHVYVFSRSEFLNLQSDFLKNKKIIQIHNIHDKEWYPNQIPNGLVFFFEDRHLSEISFLKKFKAMKSIQSTLFTKKDAMTIQQFIAKNQNFDFIIHCEYGKSRSVAIAYFMKTRFGFHVINKEEKDFQFQNSWMQFIFSKI